MMIRRIRIRDEAPKPILGVQIVNDIPPAYLALYNDQYRYLGYPGGRGAGRSWNVARSLIGRSLQKKRRILCAREFQNSIRESVHELLVNQIHELNLSRYFTITDREIRNILGSEFIFRGLHLNVSEVKSMEALDDVWCEEAQSLSKQSISVLRPTLRRPGSRLIFTWNTHSHEDPIYDLLVTNKNNDPLIRDEGYVKHVTYRDNPFLTTELEKERLACLESDLEAYAHIWDGQPLMLSEATIFAKRVKVHGFAPPTDPNTIFHHGLDFGFANDPNALIRCYQTDEPDGKHLWVDKEWYGWKTEIDELPHWMETQVPTTRRGWTIFADNARPETISYLSRQGFNIEPATKWQGSVEDGIAYLKGFKCIHIHESCKHLQDEAKFYCYKIDKKTEKVLPIVLDKWNHGWDAMRYALDGYITNTSDLGVWAKLGR